MLDLTDATAFFVYAALIAAFIFCLLLLAIFIGPKRRSEIKAQPFECGTIGSGNVSGRHSVKFYLVAMTFIIFDVEIVFFYPWALSLKSLGWSGLAAVFPFFLLLAVGLIYEWKRGVLDI